MELKEFKEILYKKLLDRGEVKDDSQSYELFIQESIEFDQPMQVFLEIVNEAVDRNNEQHEHGSNVGKINSEH